MIVELGGKWATKKGALLAHMVNESKKYVPLPFVVERNSIATYVGRDGLIKTAGVDEARIDFSKGPEGVLLTEPQSTNLYLNSDTFASQNITTTATSYTVSFYGTGTITFTGAYVGSLVGAGVSDRVSLTFTPTAGTLISTLSGVVINSQAENLGYPTTYIKTEGVMVTRLVDSVTDCGNEIVFNNSEGVLYIEMSALISSGGDRPITLSDGSGSNRIKLGYTSTPNQIEVSVSVASSLQAVLSKVLTDATLFSKIAFKWKLNDFSLWVDGVEEATDVIGVVFPPNTLDRLNLATPTESSFFEGDTKALKIYPTALTNVELTRLTTNGYL